MKGAGQPGVLVAMFSSSSFFFFSWSGAVVAHRPSGLEEQVDAWAVVLCD
jgi:hypothetical protein